MLRVRLAAAVAALLVAGCAVEHRDWAFVQSVGGIALGTPYRAASGVMLPVSVDVSGSRTITTKPTAMNSGLALDRIAVRRQGHTLSLAVITRVAGNDNHRTSSVDLALGELDPGRYAVAYAEPDGSSVEMGEITVQPK